MMGAARSPGAPAGFQDLVLIHGWGMNAGVWEILLDTLATRRRAHTLELPGHGGHPLHPPCAGGPGVLDAWADACLRSAPPRALWLGWSLGGLVALAAALREPERVQGLVLMTATPRFLQAPDWPAAMPAETLARFHVELLADPGGTLSRFLALQVRGSDRARETLRRLRQDLASRPAPVPTALAVGLALLEGQDLRRDLARLRVPSLWLFGSHDTLVPAAAARHIAPLVPGGQLRVIAGAAHAPFLSHPAETSQAIERFLDALPLDQGSVGQDGPNPLRTPGSNRCAETRPQERSQR